MESYHDIVRTVLANGELRPNRTGTPTIGIFGGMWSHDLKDGFPLLTTKQMSLKPIIAELVGFIRGVTSAADFRALGCKIWDANANDPGLPGSRNAWLDSPWREGTDDLGCIYGAQWRGWDNFRFANSTERAELLEGQGYEWMSATTYGLNKGGAVYRKRIDQLQNLIDGIKKDPYGRRHIVSAWNPGELDRMALPPCHILFQCYVRSGRFLDLQLNMRSIDTGLGLPYNIASYAAFTHLIAMLTDLTPGRISIVFGDLHVYENHVEQLTEQITREPFALPELTLRHINSLDEVTTDMFQLHGYESHPPIRMVMAV